MATEGLNNSSIKWSSNFGSLGGICW